MTFFRSGLRSGFLAALTIGLGAAPGHALAAPSAATPARPAADIARDADRKPAALIAFAGIKPGDTVADIMPGAGYFTRLFSAAVGKQGQVFAVWPNELATKVPKRVAGLRAVAAEPGYENIAVQLAPAAAIAVPKPLDVAWTSDNYHDLYGVLGESTAASFDAAVFKALKPGGVFIVIDHRAKPGTGGVMTTTLHRIDIAVVEKQVEAAGFTLEAESPILQNPADDHGKSVFDPAIKGHTDQFVLKFRKKTG